MMKLSKLLVLLLSTLVSVGYCQSKVADILTLISPELRMAKQRVNESNGKKSELSFKFVLDDSEHTLREFEGKVVLLDFWATWCSPCLRELPELNRLDEYFDDADVAVITISDESKDKIEQYTKDHPLKTINGYLNPKDKLNEPFRHLRRGRPLTFLIDRKGIIREAYMAPGSFKFFRKKIKKYL